MHSSVVIVRQLVRKKPKLAAESISDNQEGYFSE
jgi:hypothetical protein